MPTVIWQIDTGDRLVAFNDAWRRSAPVEHRAALDPAALIGRSLFSCFSTVELQTAYRQLVAAVRREQAPRRVPYRCDTAQWRRWFLLTIAPGPQSAVTFATRLIRAAPRPPQAAWESHAPRQAATREFCSHCNRVVLEPYGWFELEDVSSLSLFAGRGPPCLRPALCSDCEHVLRTAAA